LFLRTDFGYFESAFLMILMVFPGFLREVAFALISGVCQESGKIFEPVFLKLISVVYLWVIIELINMILIIVVNLIKY